MLYKLLRCMIVAVSLVKVESLKFGDHVCTTDDCKILAKKINESINTEVDPCDNFYEYACGQWIVKKSVSSNFEPGNQREIIVQTIRSRVKGLLEAESGPNEIQPIKQARKYYKLCMDEKSIEELGTKPIQSILSGIGGWPMAMDKKDWNETKFPWKKVNRYFLRKTGGYYLWGIRSFNAVKNDTFGYVILTDPHFPMAEIFPRSGDDMTSPSWENYRRLISDVVKIFTKSNGVTIDEARLLEETSELVSLEMQLHAMSLRQKTPDIYPWKDIQMGGKNISKKYDNAPDSTFDYDIIIDDLFDTAGVKPIVKQPLTIWTDNMYYVEYLPGHLQSVPQRILVNYLHWRFIEQLWTFMNKEIRDAVGYYHSEPFGTFIPLPREDECVNLLFSNMNHVVSYLYVQRYFTKNIEESAQDMVQNIRSALAEKIQNSKWLGEQPKVSAKELLNEMKFFIAFPDWYNNPSALTKYYKDFWTKSTYFHTQLKFFEYNAREHVPRFLMQKSPFDGFSENGVTPLTANAFYNLDYNSAIFPEPVFEVPSFSENYPPAVNYAMAGSSIGHEIMHAFTGSGMCSWTSSNPISLSTSEVMTIRNRAACFIYQSDKYYGYPTADDALMWSCRSLDGEYPYDPYAENNTIGQRTESENIPDTTGLQTAFLALRKKIENIYPRLVKKLPDLEHFTEDQLFFLSYANLYCTNTLYEFEDEHSQPNFRVNAAISNTVGFGEAFNCPEGKPMNPEKKCTIWDQPESI